MPATIAPTANQPVIDWANIDTVCLDMDGTLLDLAFDNWFWQQHLPEVYAQKNGLPPAAASAALMARIDAHTGTLNWYSLDFWSRETGIDITALKQAASQRISLRPNALAFLAALRDTPKKMLLTTNADPSALAIKLAQTGIAPYFDALVSSHEYGAAKEHQDFWHGLRREHPFDPARTLLLDDSLSVLTSARDYGIGHLCSIRQPDSTRPPRLHTQPFPFVDDLIEALP
jgi:putative hydrolase of the HAD superfamily